VSLHTLVATGLFSLCLALGSGIWFLVSFLSFTGCVLLAAIRPGWHLGRGMVALVVLVVLQVTTAEILVTGDVLVPAAHYLILTQFVWMVSERNSRNYGWMGLLALLQLALSGALSVGIGFGLCFALFLPVGILTLLLLNLRCELERNDLLKPSRLERSRLGPRLLLGAGVVAAVQLVITVFLFMYFPRSGRQILQLRPVASGNRLVGFSDEVSLGQIGSILDNPDVVMRVIFQRNGKPTRAVGFPFRMRGMSLEQYRNGSWRTHRAFEDSAQRPLPFPEGPLQYDPRTDIVQKVSLEPISSRVLFHLWRPIYFTSETPNLEEIEVHWRSDSYRSVRSGAVSRQYTVRSRISDYDRSVLEKSMPPSPPMARAYLQLPPSITPRVKELAERICSGIPEDNRYARALAIEAHLETTCAYTLQPEPAESGVDPVEDFLFRTQAGHCEYFAGAMVVLLRTLGIPSRMVTGFAGGEWNEYGQFYIVRQRHAHAWVEVQFNVPWQDWVSFDPAPISLADQEPDSGWLASVNRRLDALRMWWNLYVVNYSQQDQRKVSDMVTSLLSRIPGSLPTWGRDVFSIPSGAAGGAKVLVLLVVTVGGVAGIVILSVRLMRRRRRRGAKRGSGRPSLAFYRRMDDLLRKRGYQRAPSVTPAEFAEAVIRDGGQPYLPVEAVTEAFCRVRYGGCRLTPNERAEVRHCLAVLESTPARRFRP